MKIVYLLILIFISSNFFGLNAKEQDLKIVSPKNNKLQYEVSVNIVLDVNTQNINKIKIISPKDRKEITTNADKTTYCKSISLVLGENLININSYKNDLIVDKQTINIYVKSQIHREYRYEPKIYKQTFFHTDKNEAKCSKCHDMSSNEQDGIAFIDITESNCYQCHNTITKEKYAHAPAVNWLCTSCHNGKVGVDNSKYEGLSKYIAPEPVNESCFKCHKDNKKLWNNYRYRHDPLDSGRCNKCHNPHSSPYNNFVRKPVDQICLGCHKDKHIKAQALNSKCAGSSKNKRCIVCHAPHASNKAFFLRELEDINTKSIK